MHQQISFDEFVSKLSLKSDISHDDLEALVFDLFAHIRKNSEAGLWVEIEGFGSFHPLWYEIKKHTKKTKDAKKNIVKFILLGVILLATIFTFVKYSSPTPPKNTQPCESFTRTEQNTTKLSQKSHDYTVVPGNTLYTISESLYGDSKYWPFIYVKNIKNIEDMDSIYPNDVLKIPQLLENNFTQKELAEAYIKAYKAYKNLGKDEKAHWLLYWGSQNIDYGLIDTFNEDIESNDSKTVKEYIKRFGTKK